MITNDGQPLAELAAQLGDADIHVWRLAYDHRQGRQPLLGVLGAYLGLPADAVALASSEFGRPALSGSQQGAFEFNWSHSHDQALIAVARGVLPGIDLERLRAHPKAVPIARRYFSPDETDALQALPAEQRDRAFLELWTAKEAVLKALGRGLAFGLHRLSIAGSPALPVLQRLEGHEPRDWQLHRLALDEAHVGSLAWQGEPRRIRQWTLAAT